MLPDFFVQFVQFMQNCLDDSRKITIFAATLIVLVGIVDRRRWLLWFELPCFAMIYAVLM